MARQVRIEFPGASYHIYSRGNQKQPIFLSDEDRYFFLKVLGETHDKFGIAFHAYCLMPNHYHLSASTPRAGLSRSMHFASTTYTVYFNKKHKRCGHLFQGRYRAVLVDSRSYSLGLSRYIHLNPVRAGLVVSPDQYAWSSFSEYCGTRSPYPWLKIDAVLGQLDADRRRLREVYKSYVLAGIEAEAPPGYHDSKKSGVLGDDEFVDFIRRNQLGPAAVLRDRERPQLGTFRNRIALQDILEIVTRGLGSQNRFVKCATIFVGHRKADYTLAEIASFLNMSISGVSNCRRRTEKELSRNKAFARIIEEICRITRDKANGEGQTYLLSESDKR